MKKLIADLHVHTIASGHAYSTIEEIVRVASKKKIQAVAFTDHGPAMPGGPHRYYFGNLRVLPDKLYDVELLWGVESNIISYDGEVDLDDIYLKRLDLVWAGLHTPCIESGTEEENTHALLAALENPLIDGIVHPGNPAFPIHIEEVVKKASELHKLIEINNSSFIIRKGSEKYCFRIAALVKKYGGIVSVNSDAHFAYDLGKADKAMGIVQSAGLTDDCILNNSLEKIHSFLAMRGKKRFQMKNTANQNLHF